MEKNGENSKSKFKDFMKRDKERHRSEFVAAIIINIIIWYIANNLVNWNLSFISPTFIEVLGILNLLIIATIVINFIFLFYDPGWFWNLFHIPIDILGIMTAYTFLIVFPFILNEFLALVLTILIILGIIGGFIGLIIHLFKFVNGITN
jgi:hypothetical protein